MVLPVNAGSMRRPVALALIVLGLAATAAHAQPGRPPGRLDPAGLNTLLGSLGYHPREVRNEAEAEFEITVRPPDGRAITTRVALSRDGSVVWLVAWLKKVPPGRTISGNAILGMLVENDRIGPTHFSYNDSRRWFFLNKPVVNQDLTAERLRTELATLGALVARTEALWDSDRWK